MKKLFLDDLSLQELYSLLSTATTEFLNLVEENKDKDTNILLIKNKGREIETIIAQIEKRKGNSID